MTGNPHNFKYNFHLFGAARLYQDPNIRVLHLLIVWSTHLNHQNPPTNGWEIVKSVYIFLTKDQVGDNRFTRWRHLITLTLPNKSGGLHYCANRARTGLDEGGNQSMKLWRPREFQKHNFFFVFKLLWRRYWWVQKQTLQIFFFLSDLKTRAYYEPMTHCHFRGDRGTPFDFWKFRNHLLRQLCITY